MKRFTVNKAAEIKHFEHENDSALPDAKVIKVERASHIEPFDPVKRFFFRLIRNHIPRLTDWTRSWECYWQVRFVARPNDVYGPFATRTSAIKFETDRLNIGGDG